MIEVTCAVIRNEDDNVLVVQKGESSDHPFKWEFPGGKLNEGETDEECIIREIEEELSIGIVISGRLTEIVHDYGFKQIKLIPFISDTLEDSPFLKEHIASRWVPVSELSLVDFSEADILVAKEYTERVRSDSIVRSQPAMDDTPVCSEDEDLKSMVSNLMSMKEAEWIALSAVENPAIFNKLLEYSFSGDNKLAFRASWTLTKVCDKFPDLIYPHLMTVVERLGSINNESTLRSFLRIISLSDIDLLRERHHGILADQCFRLLKSGYSAIAIKVFSMEILYKLVLKYPELGNELVATINMLQQEGSAAINSRAKQILKKLSDPSNT